MKNEKIVLVLMGEHDNCIVAKKLFERHGIERADYRIAGIDWMGANDRIKKITSPF